MPANALQSNSTTDQEFIDSSSILLKTGELSSRRSRSFDEHYDNLTPDQWMTIYSHQKMGFSLWFVRQEDSGIIAVMKIGQESEVDIKVINASGDVVKNPDITFREQ